MKEKSSIIISIIISVALIVSAAFISYGIRNVKSSKNTIIITGSAKRQIKSDFVKWTGYFSAYSSSLNEAYNVLKDSNNKVKKYLMSKGIEEKDIVFSSINTQVKNEILPYGMIGNKVEGYMLSQNVEIKSYNVDLITEISRESTELINQGVHFESYPPQYYYTKIAELKIDMLGLATNDAMQRAQQIAKNTNTKVGRLRAAKMGVFQITPLYSTEVSDTGIFDTSSIDKEITAVVNCEFEIK
ncbi:SIMPL domain-containing protein [Caloramator sp. E03]|uniref:SIMPL domain-containing protein n=1 Tax=Caloramator sp. E03 TaxID=2576307 RepID=UPI00111060EC|nr:SIMPL domain-containing protein [Caloramator sp. E03]QCX32632.1 SIMPL domain-containing protein [Caloramator sp. E03]